MVMGSGGRQYPSCRGLGVGVGAALGLGGSVSVKAVGVVLDLDAVVVDDSVGVGGALVLGSVSMVRVAPLLGPEVGGFCWGQVAQKCPVPPHLV